MPFESDEWPDEPDDPDPESRWGDPEDDLVSVPTVEGSEDLDPGTEGAGIEVDGEIAKLFWGSVVYANVALGGVAVGLLLIGFRGRLTVGGVAIAVGLVALYRTYGLYRTYQERVVEGGDGGRAVDGGTGSDRENDEVGSGDDPV